MRQLSYATPILLAVLWAGAAATAVSSPAPDGSIVPEISPAREELSPSQAASWDALVAEYRQTLERKIVYLRALHRDYALLAAAPNLHPEALAEVSLSIETALHDLHRLRVELARELRAVTEPEDPEETTRTAFSSPDAAPSGDG